MDNSILKHGTGQVGKHCGISKFEALPVGVSHHCCLHWFQISIGQLQLAEQVSKFRRCLLHRTKKVHDHGIMMVNVAQHMAKGLNLLINNAGQNGLLLPSGFGCPRWHHDGFVPLQQSADAA